jgi:hypothetical protein
MSRCRDGDDVDGGAVSALGTKGFDRMGWAGWKSLDEMGRRRDSLDAMWLWTEGQVDMSAVQNLSGVVV